MQLITFHEPNRKVEAHHDALTFTLFFFLSNPLSGLQKHGIEILTKVWK